MFVRRTLTWAVFIALVVPVAGCGWWEKRKTRKDFDRPEVRAALEAMQKADGRVLAARDAMHSASAKGSDTSLLVQKIHDYSQALQDTVTSANDLSEAVRPMLSTRDSNDASELVMHYVTLLKNACAHEMGIDEIDTCGEAYGNMLAAAYKFDEIAKTFEVTLPVVRAPDLRKSGATEQAAASPPPEPAPAPKATANASATGKAKATAPPPGKAPTKAEPGKAAGDGTKSFNQGAAY